MLPVFVLSQEMLFYEDGESTIDGESRDLRVGGLVLCLFRKCFVWILYIHSADYAYGILSSFVSLQLPMMFSEEKGTTCMPLSLQLW